MAEQIRRQIQSLNDKLKSLEVSTPARRNRRKGQQVVAASSSPVTIPMRARRARKRNSQPQRVEGEMTFSRKELLQQVNVNNSQTWSAAYKLLPDTFSLLKGIAANFERIRWLKLKFYYKTGVSTMTGGMMTMGVDWDWSAPQTSRDKIAAYTPSQSFAIWKDMESTPLVLPSSRLQSRAWYTPSSLTTIDAGPGIVAAAVNLQANTTGIIGEVWAEYTVLLSGTKA